ncbi:MAG: TetR/AcrR family transcriptional regulator, partial [Haloplanus sp.]
NLADIVERGIADGVYRPVDAEAVADFLLTAMNGGTLRRATAADAVDIVAVRDEVEAYLRCRLLQEGGEE